MKTGRVASMASRVGIIIGSLLFAMLTGLALVIAGRLLAILVTWAMP